MHYIPLFGFIRHKLEKTQLQLKISIATQDELLKLLCF